MINSVDQFASLVEDGSEKSQWQIRNDKAPEAVWLEIIEKRTDLCRAVTLNKNLPESVIRILAASEDADVRTFIAMRRSVPDDVRETLARDANESVRARVAWNKKTPKHLLEVLATDAFLIVVEPAVRQLRNLDR